jgi:hypothetical protein
MNGKRARNTILPYFQEYANTYSYLDPVTDNLKSNAMTYILGSAEGWLLQGTRKSHAEISRNSLAESNAR